jgi:AcrR family transcriptional regulator
MARTKTAAARRPRGREEVMTAILGAATELLAQRSPREVTVRDVAERANVNHALVHRHFGTKDDLLRAVLLARSEAFGRAATSLPSADADSMLALLADHSDYWRIMARLMLDSPDLLVGRELPAASMILTMIGGRREPDEAMRVAAAVAGSLALGWAVFGPHLVTVLGGAPGTRVDASVAAAVRAIVSGDQAAR